MRIVKVLLIGILVIVLNQFVIFLVSLPFGYPNAEEASQMLMLSFSIVALPMVALTLLFARLLKTRSMAEAYRSGGIWTLFLILYFILIGIGNNNIEMIFQSPTLYHMFLCTFIGPMIYGRLNQLR